MTLQIVRDTVHRAKVAGIPLVFDADGLWLVNKEPGLVRGYGRAVLTPNPVEFKRREGHLKYRWRISSSYESWMGSSSLGSA